MSLQQLCCTRYSSLVHHFAIDSPFESCSWVLLQAQAAALRQVGRGGLNEQAGSSNQDSNDFEEGPPGGQRRGDASAVSTAEIVRHPSETEQVLRILAAQMRGLKHLTPQTGQCRHGIVHRFGAACKPVSPNVRQACTHIYICVYPWNLYSGCICKVCPGHNMHRLGGSFFVQNLPACHCGTALQAEPHDTHGLCAHQMSRLPSPPNPIPAAVNQTVR